eukprot:234817-Alexandrium_andersonii.AAC.1
MAEWCDKLRVARHLPQVFHRQQASRLGLDIDATELVLGLVLPESEICTQYIVFQNNYRAVYGPNQAARTNLVPFNSWASSRDAHEYVASIARHGRPYPP